MDRSTENGEDEEEELGAMSYEWTLMLLTGDKTWAPTRYELFNARKEHEELIKHRRMLVAEMEQAVFQKKQTEKMLDALKNCTSLLMEVRKEGKEKQERIKNLIRSNRTTRSMITKFENSKTEMKAIMKEAHEFTRNCNDLLELENLEETPVLVFVQGVSKLNDRICEYKSMMDSLVQSFEQ